MAFLQLQVFTFGELYYETKRSFTIKETTGERYYLLRKKANFVVESHNRKKSTRLFLKCFRGLALGKESHNI